MKTAAKLFMMVFRFSPQPEYEPTEKELETMHQQWGAFIGNIAIKEKLVSTHRLGLEGKLIETDKSVMDSVAPKEGKVISGNMVVKANSLEEAVDMAKDCPILNMQGTVEVRTILPMNNQ